MLESNDGEECVWVEQVLEEKSTLCLEHFKFRGVPSKDGKYTAVYSFIEFSREVWTRYNLGVIIT